jgi:hypothetical protein
VVLEDPSEQTAGAVSEKAADATAKIIKRREMSRCEVRCAVMRSVTLLLFEAGDEEMRSYAGIRTGANSAQTVHPLQV